MTSIGSASRFAVIWRASGLAVLVCWQIAVAAGAQKLEIRGRVLGEGGRPLAEAELVLLPDSGNTQKATLQLEGPLEIAPAARARSAPDGSFRLLAPEAGFWALLARHPAYLEAVSALRPLLRDVELEPVELFPRHEVAVHVAAADGTPVAGARVRGQGWSKGEPAQSDRGWVQYPRWGTSGPDGIAYLATTAGEQLRVAALAAGSLGVADFTEAQGELELVLDQPLRDTWLIDEDGRALAGVTVYLRFPPFALGTSDPQGLLRLPARTRMGELKFLRNLFSESSIKKALPTIDLFGSPALRLTASETREIEVVDALSQRPIAGALIWGDAGHLRTDARGRAQLEMLPRPPRHYDPPDREVFVPIIIGTPGYFSRALGSLELIKPPRSGLEVVALNPAVVLEGRVLDLAGRPIEGAEVRSSGGIGSDPPAVEWSRKLRWHTLGLTHTDAGGRFRFPLTAVGRPLRLDVQRQGFGPIQREIPPLERGARAPVLEIRLEPTIAASGRILDLQERPIAGAEVVLMLPHPSRSMLAKTDVEGYFHMTDLTAGSASLFARASGFANLTVPGIGLARGAAPVDLGAFLLEPALAIEGRVVDGEGRPLAGVAVFFRYNDMPMLCAPPGYAELGAGWA